MSVEYSRMSGEGRNPPTRSRAGGETLADTRGLDPLRRISILGRYLAPGSDFREGLVRSLFRRER